MTCQGLARIQKAADLLDTCRQARDFKITRSTHNSHALGLEKAMETLSYGLDERWYVRTRGLNVSYTHLATFGRKAKPPTFTLCGLNGYAFEMGAVVLLLPRTVSKD